VLDQDELRADQGAAGHAIAQASASARQSAAQTELLEHTLPTKVRQAEAQVEQAQAQLQQTRAQVAQTQAQLRQAQAQVAQTQAAGGQGPGQLQPHTAAGAEDINPPQDLVAAQTDLDSAKASEQAAEAGVEATGRVVAAAEAGVEAFERRRGGGGAGRAGGRPAAGKAGPRANSGRPTRCARPRRRPKPMPPPPRRASARPGSLAPASGIVTLRAARQGEVVNPGSPDRHALRLELDLGGCRRRGNLRRSHRHGRDFAGGACPSGTEVSGPVIYKAVEADFATQRDVSRTKRDIKDGGHTRTACPIPRGSSRWA